MGTATAEMGTPARSGMAAGSVAAAAMAAPAAARMCRSE
jgi:hypothetical protein